MDLKIEKILKGIKNNFVRTNPNFRRILLLFGAFLFLSGTLLIDFIPKGIRDIQVGRPSTETITAPRNIEFIDRELTEKLKQKAANSVEPVSKYDPVATAQVKHRIHGFFDSIKQVKSDPALDHDQQIEKAEERVGALFSDDLLRTALSLSDEDLDTLETSTIEIIDQVMRDKILDDDVKVKKDEIELIASSLPYGRSRNNLIAKLGAGYLRPNYSYDAARTKTLRAEAAAGIKPQVVTKVKDEVIVREAEIVTQEHLRILRKLDLLSVQFEIAKILGILLLVFGILVICSIYLFKYQKPIYARFPLLLLLAILLGSITVLAKVITSFQIPPLIIPIAGIAMLTTILFNSRTAIVIVIISSLLTGVMVKDGFQYVTVSILSSLLAIYLVSRISRRTDLTKAGIIVGLGMAYLGLSVSLITGLDIKDVFVNSGWGLASGFASSILTIGTLPFFESVFDITTDIRLLELSDPTQPLLKELMVKAPGTYNHSIITANLTEGAAEAIGASPLIARVGAYYHDIGKIKRPFFFVENQLGGENPHDRTNPNLSYLIITAHVKEGVEVANKYKLPAEIVDIIREHHGTSVVTYFFHRAKERKGKEEVSEARFRYSGDKPKTKEAALVMLADSVEAAARTVSKPSPNRLEQLIKKIIQTKLKDGQLDESLLTMSDMEKITKSFVQSITTIYHSRIEYPEGEVVPFTRGRPAHGSSNK